MEIQKCPCCNSQSVTETKYELLNCSNCQHLFRKNIIAQDYKEKHNRNNRVLHTDRKNRERYEFLKKYKFSSMIDVGCAEGFLGAYLKQKLTLKRVDGVELSMDKIVATKNLDHVYDHDIHDLGKFKSRYDVLSLFHVVEHIQNPIQFLSDCLALSNKYICIEVPNQSGNAHVEYDLNQEHIHFFSPLSMMHLMKSVGLKILHMETRGFESPRYNDCIRVMAIKPAVKTDFLERVIERCGDKFYIYGTGGNFLALIKPVDKIMEHVIGILDKEEKKEYVKHNYLKVDEVLLKREKILISSIDFFEEIKMDLMIYGIENERIIGIEDILSA
ncbi:MAG: class I SAM-dependent methyltransferase [Bacteroidetes bacterium]|nr:class I SAM-dependent methyltransferase [Bacteroidota bacterium]